MAKKDSSLADVEISSFAPTRIETNRHIIHMEPRISATKLAEYVVADPSRQETIAKQAKRAPKAIMIPYSRVRRALSEALGAEGLRSDFLVTRAVEAEKSPFQNSWQKDDNDRSAIALRHLADVASQIDCKKAQRIHRPENGWPPLDIYGVRVSVQPELIFALDHRGIKKVGAIILNTGRAENLSLKRNNGRFSVGDYLTVLVYRMLDVRLKAYGMPLHTKCHAIDIFRSEIYTAPASYKTLLKHMESACRMIALQWDAIPLEVDFDHYGTEKS